MDIYNDRELIAILTPVIADAIDAVAGAILSLIQYHIQKDVYGNGNIPHVYERTFEFLDSWIKEVDKSDRTKEVVARIFSDADRMSYEPSKFVHGSRLSGDFREHLAEAIEEGLGYKFFGEIRKDRTKNPAAKKRRFFTHTVNELSRNGTLMKWFEMEMAARGITLKKKRM